MLNIGWVDFSKSDRDMVMTVLRQLSEPGAMDELGIGTVRDAFSDILFPGTSTIQTRAKYLFIIPYLCLEIERQGIMQPREFISLLEQNELDLIDVLDKNGAAGIIGSVSRQTLRRKPSSIYWNALRTYGIFTEQITLPEYAALAYSKQLAASLQKTSGKQRQQNEDDSTDDSDKGQFAFWRVPLPKKEWRNGLSIELTKDEAIHLSDKIISMPKTKDSLLAFILNQGRTDFPEFKSFSDIDGLKSIMPSDMWHDYTLARDFSNFIFGAQVRYNVIFSEGQNEEAVHYWNEYIADTPAINLDEIRIRLKPRKSVMRFLEQYQSSLHNEAKLDRLIIGREKSLKGASRAKLTNKELYQYDGSRAVNMARLTYRLSNVQNIVRDIFKGVSHDA